VGNVKEEMGGENQLFVALSVNMLKTAADMAKVIIND